MYTNYQSGKKNVNGRGWYAHFMHNDTLLTVNANNGRFLACVIHDVYCLADRQNQGVIVWEGIGDTLDGAIDLVYDAYHKGLKNIAAGKLVA